jgi:peptidyl-prolyl cis-trans isomerase SurA
MQLVERRGDVADVRNILIAPNLETGDLLNSKLSLDTIYIKLQADTTTFSDLAAKFSDDAESKNSGGLIVNPYSGSTRFEMDEIGQMDQNIAFAIDKVKVGEYTRPMPFTTRDGKQAYRILYLKTLTAPHKANLKEDYQRIQAAAVAQKEKTLIKEWVKKKVVSTYVRIADDYKNCNFSNKWIN